MAIGSDNGLSPGRRQAIIWTNSGILLIGPLGTSFTEILIEIHIFSFTKMRFKVSSAKWQPFCFGLNVLIHYMLNFSEGTKKKKKILFITVKPQVWDWCACKMRVELLWTCLQCYFNLLVCDIYHIIMTFELDIIIHSIFMWCQETMVISRATPGRKSLESL